MLKNKYDILLKEIKKVNKVAIPMLFKSLNMIFYCIKMNDEKVDINTLKLFSDMLPTIKAIANTSYELNGASTKTPRPNVAPRRKYPFINGVISDFASASSTNSRGKIFMRDNFGFTPSANLSDNTVARKRNGVK